VNIAKLPELLRRCLTLPVASLREYYLLVRFFDPPFEKSRVPSEKKF
jgi:hypothetical protein